MTLRSRPTDRSPALPAHPHFDMNDVKVAPDIVEILILVAGAGQKGGSPHEDLGGQLDPRPNVLERIKTFDAGVVPDDQRGVDHGRSSPEHLRWQPRESFLIDEPPQDGDC